MKDDNNPEYMMQTISNVLLGKAIKGEIDLIELAKQELKNRGYNVEDEWVGFDKTNKEYFLNAN